MGMREFQARHRALQAVTDEHPTAAAVQAVGGNYAVLEVALKNDVNAVRAFPSIEKKIEYKRDKFLPKWLEFVTQYLNEGKTYQNDYFVYCIIYLFDVGDFDRALDLAYTAISQQQSMPQGFRSNLATFVADQIYSWADKNAAVGQSVEPYFSQTFKNVATAWQLHEVITAKWLKFAAALLLRNAQGKVHAAGVQQPEKLILAIQLCNRAFQLNHKAGVKNMIERCIMRLKALQQNGVQMPDKFPQMIGLSAEYQEINFDAVIKALCPDHSLAQTDEKEAESEPQGGADV